MGASVWIKAVGTRFHRYSLIVIIGKESLVKIALPINRLAKTQGGAPLNAGEDAGK